MKFEIMCRSCLHKNVCKYTEQVENVTKKAQELFSDAPEIVIQCKWYRMEFGTAVAYGNTQGINYCS